MLMVLREHWPEYLMEAVVLGIFMISACVFATILGHSASPIAEALLTPSRSACSWPRHGSDRGRNYLLTLGAAIGASESLSR
jgi:hypothetical protein